MALHVLSSGLRPLSWSDAKAGLLDVRHQVRRDMGEIVGGDLGLRPKPDPNPNPNANPNPNLNPNADPNPNPNQGLMIWRRMIHLWVDGISFGDGPLVPASEPAAARLMVRVRV